MSYRRLPMRLNETLTKGLVNEIQNYLFDCDGVIWNWPNAIEGAVECINKLKLLGKNCFFVTNNSTKTREMIAEQVKSIGIKNVKEDDIVCTSWVLASYLKSINFKDRAYVIGNSSMAKEMDKLGIDYCGIGPIAEEYSELTLDQIKKQFLFDTRVKCVIVGFDYHFNYLKMLIGTTYAHQEKCLFIATNDDAVFPSGPNSQVVIPGTGTIVNAMRTSIGRDPIILGKPYKTMWEILRDTHNITESNSCMIGDRLETDILFGNNCGLRYSIAVLTGITSEEEILKHANNNDDNNNQASSLLVPDYYVDSLNNIGNFI